jgi:hypothetical protein
MARDGDQDAKGLFAPVESRPCFSADDPSRRLSLSEGCTAGAASNSMLSAAMVRALASTPQVASSQHMPPARKATNTLVGLPRRARKENSRLPCPHTAGLPGKYSVYWPVLVLLAWARGRG